MTLEWLAAVLRPEDLAPHPNFMSERSDYSAHELLAAALTGDANRASVLRQFLASDTDKNLQFTAVRLAIGTLDSANIDAATLQLADVLTSGRLDAEVAGPLALVAMAAAGELEDLSICEAIASAVLAALTHDGHSSLLIRASVLQQLSLRRKDFNGDWLQLCAESAKISGRLLEEFPALEIEPFVLSAGRSGDSFSSIRHIIVALQRASWSLAPSYSFGETDQPFQDVFPTWQERIKAERSEQFLFAERRSASQYALYVRDMFDSAYGNESIVWGRVGPELFHSALVYELYGSGQVPAARKELALFRLLMSATGYAPTSHADCLRLLRYSNAKKELQLTISKIRNGGPLDALAADARRVIRSRLTVAHLRNGELQVLRGAADLLNAGEALEAFDVVIELVRAGAPLNLMGHYEAYQTRMEEPLRAASALANTANAFQTLTADFLLILERSGFDELLDRSFARALNGLNWEALGAGETRIWSEWAAQEDLLWTRTREIVRTNLGLRAYPADKPLDDLLAVADALNDALRGHSANYEIVKSAPALVISALREIRVNAGRGRFSGGGVSAPELAVLLIADGATEIWPELVSLLIDPLVSREDKTPAFERLADSDLILSRDVALMFRENALPLLENAGISAFTQDTLVPYPAALSFFARFEILPPSQVLIEVNRLAASQAAKSHAAAASCAVVLAKFGKSDWIVPLSVQLTYDADVAVVGRAARALAYVVAEGISPYRILLADRLAELLAADGVLIPLYVIRAVADTEGALTRSLYNAVEVLSVSHRSMVVRSSALKLIDSI